MSRPGAVSLAELLLVFWLFALVLLGVARFASAQGRIAATQMDRSRLEEVIRTTAVILESELRYLEPSADLTGGPDSIRIRAFRGAGVLCGASGREVRLHYTGVRRPDPDKDSVLLVTGGGELGPFGLESAAGAVQGEAWERPLGCDGAGLMRLTLSVSPGPVSGVGLVFETGAYHLRNGALRYRRGGGGRQPLTEGLLDDPEIEWVSDAAVLVLPLLGDSLPRLNPVERRLRLTFLNGGPP